MKLTFKNCIVTAATIFFASCNTKTETKKISTSIDFSETFKSIAHQENIDFYKKDIKAWRKHFLHSNSVYWICVEDDVTLRATGWDDLNQFVSQWMKDNPAPEADTLLKLDTIDDFKVELSHGLAFVSYKKNHMMHDGKVIILLESRIFKLVDNEWKILGMISAPGYTTPKSSANVFVHNNLQK